MEFLKNNLFYVILVAAVLVISIPSYILASAREAKHALAVADAQQKLNIIKNQAERLQPVAPDALKKAGEYQQGWAALVKQVEDMMSASDTHMDREFLVPAADGDLPDPVAYKAAYGKAYDELVARLVAAKIADADKSPLDRKADWSDRTPAPKEIRVTQKQYWILKELVDMFTDPACHVRHVTSVALDIVPNQAGASNHPYNVDKPAESKFWVYPVKLDFQIDFRYFNIFLGKLADDDKVMFVTDSYSVARGFSEQDAVYEPVVAVSLYCLVYDYISSDFEKASLAQYKPGTGGAKGATGKKKGK
jgi:hypothetical protein